MKRMILLAVSAGMILSGCGATPQSREAGSTVDVGVLGIEQAADGLVVYAAPQGRQEETTAVLRGAGPAPAAAVEALSASGDRVVSCAHVEHILLGQKDAPVLEQVLSYAFQEPQQSTESQLWMVRTEELSAVFEGEENPSRRMNVLKAAGKDRQGFCPVTLREAAAAVAEKRAILVPALEQTEEGLAFDGYALYKDSRVLAWLTEETALGASLLLGDRIHWMESAGDSALSLQSGGCRVSPVLESGQLMGIEVACRLEGVTTGGWEGKKEDIVQMESSTEAAIRAALKVMQKANADGTGLSRRVGLVYPLRWRSLSEQWDERFSELHNAVSVQIHVTERY